MDEAESNVAAIGEMKEEEMEMKQKHIRNEREKFIKMQKKWLDATKKIASLEAQVNMHRLREDTLICEMVELRKNQEEIQTKFDEERREWMRDMRSVQDTRAQNADNGKAEIEMLKAEVAQLKSSLDDAERTRLFLLEDNGKIKQQKAKLRCDFNELKREHNRLLSSQQAGISSRSDVLCDRTGTENIPNGGRRRNELQNANNLESAILSISKTCSVYIPPVPSVKSDHSTIVGSEADSGCDRSPDAGPEDVDTRDGNVEKEKLVEELTEKLKRTDEKNKELRKTLLIVDEQCEKLVKNFQEIKQRYEEMERTHHATNESTSGEATQGSSCCERSDVETERGVGKNRKLLLKKLSSEGKSGLSVTKRKNTSCFTAFGKRSKHDLC